MRNYSEEITFCPPAVPREGALYVGDSEVDVETARRSGLDLVGVSWGFRGRELLRQAGAEQMQSPPPET